MQDEATWRFFIRPVYEQIQTQSANLLGRVHMHAHAIKGGLMEGIFTPEMSSTETDWVLATRYVARAEMEG